MTDFDHRFRPWTDPWSSRDVDDLDDALNTNPASGPNSSSNGSEGPDSLATTAREFHQRMEQAHERYPGAGRPDPDLWDRIIGGQQTEAGMSTSAQSLNTGKRESLAVTSGLPAPGSKPWMDSRIVNVIAAALLIVAIGAGYWFSGIGPAGGGSNEDPLRFAAQGITPAASPQGSAVKCDVEPVTEDDAVSMVRDPSAWIERISVGEAPAIPGTVAHGQWYWAYPESGRTPTDEAFRELQTVVNGYLACMETGTLPQLWAYMDPHSVRMSVQDNPTTSIPESEIEFRVSQKMDNLAEWTLSGMSFGPDDYRFMVTSNPDHARVVEIEGVQVAFVGTETFDRDGTLVQSTDWRDRRAIDSGEESDSATLGAITLLRYPGIDKWLVYDVVMGEIEWRVATPAAVMPGEHWQAESCYSRWY